MITKIPNAKAAPAKPTPEPEPSAVERALLALPSALRAALAAMPKPITTIQTPPRQNEWVFSLKRNATGQIETITAKGQTTK